LLLFLAPAVASAATIDHAGVACVVAGRFPSIEARIAPLDQLAKARTFFHADADQRWYYVEMKAEGGVFRGVLPQPLKATKRIHYYIEATEKDVSQNRTQEFAAEVVPDAGACRQHGGRRRRGRRRDRRDRARHRRRRARGRGHGGGRGGRRRRRGRRRLDGHQPEHPVRIRGRRLQR
jgi:hypothetical protein